MFKKAFVYFLLVAAMLLAACGAVAPATSTPAPTQTARVEVVMQVVEVTAQPDATKAPAATEGPAEEVTVDGEFSISGVPESVDPMTVDTAKGTFVNTLGLGTEGWLAEPGKLLVGPDFPQDLIDSSGGAIERFNALNQDSCNGNPPCIMMVPGGGFTFASAGWGTFNVTGTFGTATVTLTGQPGHNNHVYVRGLYGDGLPDTDENTDMVWTAFDPGHVDLHFYPGQPNGGFVSEEQFLEKASTSTSGGTNCGDAGCSSLSALFIDLNTGAYVLITRDSPDSEWKLVAHNW